MNDYIMVVLTRQEVDHILLRWMAVASWKCYNENWHPSTCEILPMICRQMAADNLFSIPESGRWDKLTLREAMMMCHLADRLGYWVDKDCNPYIPECDKT